ncbi:MAG: sigma-54 interaction domain-containing protein, partial [Bacteroidota bacterium]
PTDFVLSNINAYHQRRLEKERNRSNRNLERNIEEILAQKTIIGVSAAAERLRDQVRKYAESNANILIVGRSGTGKEVVAYNIHYRSRRRFDPFVPINCGSIPNDLVESELFGYEKGAFTGANQRKPGLFELANHGTLFLDEIGELPLSAQVKLLRVIEDGEIEKIGRTERIKVDVRIIAATNKDLEQEVAAKRFREDLLYRLNVVTIYVPPLSERREDIPVLFEHYLEKFSVDMGKRKPVVEVAALDVLKDHIWRGNVRELKNVVQRLLFCEEPVITSRLVKSALEIPSPLLARGNGIGIDFGSPQHLLPWREMEMLVRKKYFSFVRENSGSDAEAARKLGLAPPNYHRMCKELGLK